MKAMLALVLSLVLLSGCATTAVYYEGQVAEKVYSSLEECRAAHPKESQSCRRPSEGREPLGDSFWISVFNILMGY